MVTAWASTDSQNSNCDRESRDLARFWSSKSSLRALTTSGSRLAGLIDPWDSIVAYHEGAHVDCVVRQITERHLTCEIIEGLEGSIFIEELSWGSAVENRELLKSYKVGQRLSAAIVSINKDWRRIILSVKRLKESDSEVLYKQHANAVVSARIEMVDVYYAVVTLAQGRVRGRLDMRDTFWWGDLRRSLNVGRTLDVKVIAYDFGHDSITVGTKGVTCNGFSEVVRRVSVGDTVVCEVLFNGYDRLVVLVMLDTYRAHGYVHVSEISDLMFVTDAIMRRVFVRGTCWSCIIKRFDEKNECIELSRKAFLKQNVSTLQFAEPYEVEVIEGRRGELVGYSDQVEGAFIDSGKGRIPLGMCTALVASIRDRVELSSCD